MVKRSILLLALALALLLPGALALAQQAEPSPSGAATSDPNVQITWPKPISEVSGVIDVIGVASIPNMSFYRLEAIALNSDLSVPENAGWIPLTTDITTPVTTASTLAQVDTTKLPDGLYQFRLDAFTGTIAVPTAGESTTTGPIRVSNDIGGGAGVTPTPGPTATLAPASRTVQAATVIASSGAVNIRLCAVIDNNACPVTGYLAAGDSAQILGLSSDGAGWYLISTSSGLTGWVSSTVVTVNGDTSSVPIVTPPTPMPTPPPAPPAPPAPPDPPAGPTAVPGSGLTVPTGIGTQYNATPQCGQTFNVEINMANIGNAQAAAGTVTLQDIHVDSGTVTFTGYGNYPALDPGQNYVVVISANVTAYVGNNHELRAINNGQQQTTRYTLGVGSCGSPPPATPTPTPNPPKPTGVVTFSDGQCAFTVKDGTKYYDTPQGNKLGTINSGGYGAYLGDRVNGKRWYQINIGQMVWVREQDIVHLPTSCRGV